MSIQSTLDLFALKINNKKPGSDYFSFIVEILINNLTAV
jgi:hypothetical protein